MIYLWLLLFSHLLANTHSNLEEGLNKTRALFRKKREIIRPKLLTTPERVEAAGYPIEIHKVTTEDGYIIEIHRIPLGWKWNRNVHHKYRSQRPVVLLMHGLMGSSIDWLQNYPDNALGFMLADRGFDVWILNSRGNKYSRNHVTFSVREKEFWMYSWHEIAIYDLPAVIDYSLTVTCMKKVSYIGYSLGATILSAMLSERPDYNHKISSAALLGPAIYLTHSEGALLRFSALSKPLEKVFNLLKMWEINPQTEFLKSVTATLCSKKNQFLNRFCWNLYSRFVIQINQEFVEREFLPYVLSNLPAGVSVKTGLHFWQIKNADRFQKYNYGRKGNYRVYGTLYPPLYDLNKTLIPVAIFSALNDEYSVKEDVDRLAREYPNVVLRYEIQNENFSHFNFLWSNFVFQDLNNLIIKFLCDYL